MNQTLFFLSRVLFLASGFHEKKHKKMSFVKGHSTCQRPVGWTIVMWVPLTQPRGRDFIVFSITLFYSVTKMLLKISFYYILQLFKKNKCS